MSLHPSIGIRRAFSPMILVNWIFGIGVIEYPAGRRRRLFSACYSIAHFLLSIFFVQLADLSSMPNVQGSLMAAYTYRICVYLYLCLFVVCICEGHLRSQSLNICGRTLAVANTSMNRLGIPDEYADVFKSQMLELAVMAFGFVIIMVLDFLFVTVEYESKTKRACFLTAVHYLTIMAVFTDWSFIIGIKYLGNRFQRLNVFLGELGREGINNEANFRNSHDSWEKVLENLPVTIGIRRASRLRESVGQEWIVDVLRRSRNIHRDLGKVAKELNAMYSIRLLASTAMTYALGLSLSYVIYVSVASQATETRSTWFELTTMTTSCWIFFQCVKLFAIIHTCSATCNEARRTARLIHELSIRIADRAVRDEIRSMSLQFMQNPVIFTAGNFFQLDYTMLRGTVGSISTFLVIMIQMQSIYERQQNRTTQPPTA